MQKKNERNVVHNVLARIATSNWLLWAVNKKNRRKNIVRSSCVWVYGISRRRAYTCSRSVTSRIEWWLLMLCVISRSFTTSADWRGGKLSLLLVSVRLTPRLYMLFVLQYVYMYGTVLSVHWKDVITNENLFVTVFPSEMSIHGSRAHCAIRNLFTI